MHAEIERVFANLTATRVVARLEADDIANARLTHGGVRRNQQIAARGRWAKVARRRATDVLKPHLISPASSRDGWVALARRAHRAILAELGYSEREIEALVCGRLRAVVRHAIAHSP